MEVLPERENRIRPRIDSLSEAAARQRVLLQDVDKGAKCLSCTDCSGFQLHVWRKTCANCQCPREEHDITAGDSPIHPSIDPLLKGRKQQAEEALLKLWQRLKLRQDPEYDHDHRKCSSVNTDSQRRKFDKINAKRKKEYSTADVVAGDHAKTKKKDHASCGTCGESLEGEEHIIAAKAINKFFHLACFCCDECHEPIINNGFYVFRRKNKKDLAALCGRCHAEKYAPRCQGCDELILDESCTRAEDSFWHLDHFCCILCDQNLAGKQYTKDDKERPVCLPCYNAHVAPECLSCKLKITAEETCVEVAGASFHKTQKCFACCVCKKYIDVDDSSTDGVIENNQLYCVEHAEELGMWADMSDTASETESASTRHSSPSNVGSQAARLQQNHKAPSPPLSSSSEDDDSSPAKPKPKGKKGRKAEEEAKGKLQDEHLREQLRLQQQLMLLQKQQAQKQDSATQQTRQEKQSDLTSSSKTEDEEKKRFGTLKRDARNKMAKALREHDIKDHASKCARCGKPAKGQCVRINKALMHPECFTCEICSFSLLKSNSYSGDVYNVNGRLSCQACANSVRQKNARLAAAQAKPK